MTSIHPSRSRPLLLAWILVPALLTALAGSAFAERLESSTPKVFNGDLRNLPRALGKPPAAPPDRGSAKSLQGPILNFAGQGYTGTSLPDTTGDVGLQHYIQMVNSPQGSVFTVYNKTDGSVAAGPIRLGSLGTGDCAGGNGEGSVLYDQLADRWLLSEFSDRVRFEFSVQCVYVSQTNDPVAGGWFAYSIITNDTGERPNFGVWPDGYYQAALIRPNPENPSAPQDPSVSVLERAQMLVGGPARSKRFNVPRLAGFGRQELTPADTDGNSPPPAGAPNPFMRHRDDEVHNPGANDPAQDFLEIWEFHVDWTTPESSTVTGPINIPVAEFDSDLCGLSSPPCIPQPGGPALDPRREQIMHRLQYRNFGTHQTLVGNFVTDVDGTDHGGIRWFELRNTGGGGGSSWSVHQEGTLAPDAHHRWLGSAAMDGLGNLAIGYSVASATLYPSIAFAARKAADPPGTLQPEVPVIAGAAANASNFWGRTAALSVDPVDDETFWFTTEYTPSSSWATRIATFRLGDPPVTSAALGFYTLTPCRLVDTRHANGPNGGPALQPFSQRTFVLTGSCGVPAGAKALSLNLTVTETEAPGYLTLFPADTTRPLISSINFAADQTRANNAVLLLAVDGTGALTVFNAATGDVHFLLDVNGYFE